MVVPLGLGLFLGSAALSKGVRTFSVGPNGTLQRGGLPYVAFWATVWDWVYALDEEAASTLATSIKGYGYNGVEINLLDGSLSATNVNGRSLLPTSDPAAIDYDFLADCVPLIKAISNRGLTVILNLVWGTHINVGAGSSIFNDTNAATFGTEIAQWVKDNFGGSNVIICLMADSAPVTKTTAGVVQYDFRSVVDAMGEAVDAVLPKSLITLHPAVPVVGTNANFDGGEIVTQSISDYWDDKPSWADISLLQSGHVRTRPRASSWENMYRAERAEATGMPYMDIENGYLEIPATLPADASAVALASNPITTVSGSSAFQIEFASGHGLTTPTDGGKSRWVYPIGVTATGGMSFGAGYNCLVTGVISSTVLECQHPTQAASSSTSGGGSSGTARRRVEYLEAERLSEYQIRVRAWMQMILGSFGHCESAEGFYNVYTGPEGSNDKYLPQILYTDALDAMAAAGSRYAVEFFRQRPLAKRVAQNLTVASTSSFVRVWNTNATYYLNNTTSGGRQNIAGNNVQGCVADDYSYAAVISISGQEFDLNLRDFLTQGETYEAYWINPRTGAVDYTGRVYRGGSYSAGVYQFSGGTEYASGAVRELPIDSDASWQAVHFKPPTTDTAMPNAGTISTRVTDPHDWVLVIEKQGAYPALSLQ